MSLIRHSSRGRWDLHGPKVTWDDVKEFTELLFPFCFSGLLTQACYVDLFRLLS